MKTETIKKYEEKAIKHGVDVEKVRSQAEQIAYDMYNIPKEYKKYKKLYNIHIQKYEKAIHDGDEETAKQHEAEAMQIVEKIKEMDTRGLEIKKMFGKYGKNPHEMKKLLKSMKG
jgi:hypothetical protein